MTMNVQRDLDLIDQGAKNLAEHLLAEIEHMESQERHPMELINEVKRLLQKEIDRK